ncbi:MAG: class I mannose-6-phosphate isomerase [Mycoplasma sp.]|nr:class I mannose-6-phosphate isomerase [Candidatus Hennigella equi]
MLPNIYRQPTTEPIGEAWILSCLGENNSRIDDKTTLADVVKANPNLIAKDYQGEFPLLIKLIDANDDLSIQVHPQSKTEFWHIISPTPSKLYFGFKKDTTKDEVENLLKQGQITSILNYIDVSAGDSYLINPGTIHAIGKGTFLIEIQQNVDATYRLFDYNRVDADGKPRELHIEQALYCINYNQTRVFENKSFEHIMQTSFFNVFKYHVTDKKQLDATEKSFHALVVLSGNGNLKAGDQNIALNQYDTYFIPAGTGVYELSGDVTVIVATI